MKYFLFSLCFAGFFILSAGETPYGMAAHLNRMPQPEMRRELDEMKRLGYEFVRFDTDWDVIEKNPGERNYSKLDPAVDECLKRGMTPLLILPGNMPSRVKPPFEHRAEWKSFVGDLVRHYKGRVRYYEIFNEVDCPGPWGGKPSPENYTTLLLESRKLIREIDPAAVVLFSGLSDFNDPFPFWERAFKAGAGDGFDVINMHPYQMKNVPESRLPRQISRLRELMARYHLDKPIWITEFGNSTSPFREEFTAAVVREALKKLKINPENFTCGIIADDSMLFYTDAVNLSTHDYLPATVKRLPLTFAELETIDVSSCPVVALPPSEEFPATELPRLLSYIRRGGTVIIPGGLPFYFNLIRQPNGYFDRVQVNKKLIAPFHIDWFASWTRPGTPHSLQKIAPNPEFPNLRIRQLDSYRFLSADNLKGNDRMIPLVEGFAENGFKAPIAALYMFDSELSGNIILLVNADGATSTSETKQAQLFVRHYLTALGSGVKHVFYYRFRAGEFDNGTESHYGILHRNFRPKPAVAAAAELVRQCPRGSSQIQLRRISDGLFRADWIRPDGVAVCALWSAGRSIPVTITHARAAYRDWLGTELTLMPDNHYVATPGVGYFHAVPGKSITIDY